MQKTPLSGSHTTNRTSDGEKLLCREVRHSHSGIMRWHPPAYPSNSEHFRSVSDPKWADGGSLTPSQGRGTASRFAFGKGAGLDCVSVAFQDPPQPGGAEVHRPRLLGGVRQQALISSRDRRSYLCHSSVQLRPALYTPKK